MTEVTVDVSEINEMILKLKKLGVDVEKIVDDGLNQGAMQIQKTAKNNIRAKKIFDTGWLFRSISVEKTSKGYYVGTNVEHGLYNEFGTGLQGDPRVPHTQRRYWRYQDEEGKWHTTYGMIARPFLRPAFEVNKTYVINAVASKLLREVKRRIKGG